MDADESEYRPSLRLTRGPFLPNLTRMPFGARRCAPVHVAPLNCRDDGKRMILGVSCALSEAEIHWREFLGHVPQIVKTGGDWLGLDWSFGR
jgi:hypothetical protein